MDNTDDTTNRRKNKHLNAFERGQIQLLNAEALSPYAIGKRLNRVANTIRNELARGTVTQIKAIKAVDIDLPLKVKRSTKKKRVRNHKKVLGRSISERPAEINDRSEFGHWEIDSVIGKKTKGQPTLMTITERKTPKELIRKVSDQSAESIMNALKTLAEEAEIYSQQFSKA